MQNSKLCLIDEEPMTKYQTNLKDQFSSTKQSFGACLPSVALAKFGSFGPCLVLGVLDLGT